MWPHSYNSHDKSLANWEGEHWADPGAVPSLVLELALSQLRNLLGVDSQDSSVSAVAVAEAEEWPHDVDAERL